MLGEGTALYCPSCCVATSATSIGASQQPQSSTPRTDVIVSRLVLSACPESTLAEHARILETELNEAKTDLAGCKQAGIEEANWRITAEKERDTLSTIADGLATALAKVNKGHADKCGAFYGGKCKCGFKAGNIILAQYQTYVKSKKG